MNPQINLSSQAILKSAVMIPVRAVLGKNIRNVAADK